MWRGCASLGASAHGIYVTCPIVRDGQVSVDGNCGSELHDEPGFSGNWQDSPRLAGPYVL